MASADRYRIVVLDFGSQYSHLIVRRLRQLHVYSEMLPCTASIAEVSRLHPKGVILSGGPSSVYEEGSPHVQPGIWDLGKIFSSIIMMIIIIIFVVVYL